MDILFQKATDKEVSLIRNLAEKSWRSAYAEILSPQQIDYMLAEMYAESEILTQLQTIEYQYYIVFYQGIAVGFMGFQLHFEPGTTKLHRLYLIPEVVGKGIGKASISFLKERILSLGDGRIILNVNKNNFARKIYESQGFNIYEEAVIDIGQGFVMDDYLMEIYLKN